MEKQAGKLTAALQGFDHPLAQRDFEWDVAQAGWTGQIDHLFSGEKQKIAALLPGSLPDDSAGAYATLRKSVVHNDANDNNVVVSKELVNPSVRAIIDYGDAIHTQVINDLAICHSLCRDG